MKSKTLIEMLQKADPTGNEEVCVGNVDIHFVETMPAYYDGTLQVLERNEELECYNIIGAKYRRSGVKFNTDGDKSLLFFIIIVFCLFGSVNAFRDVLKKAELIDAQVLEKVEK